VNDLSVEHQSHPVFARWPSIIRNGLLACMIAAWTPQGVAAGFSAVQPMQQIRDTFGATLLTSGEVLVAGGAAGLAGTPLSSVEIYDATGGNWAPAAPLATARYDHTVTRLANGKVLVAGGSNGSNDLTSAELFDPTTGLWSSAGTLTTRRAIHTATLLPSGKVLVVGGTDSVALQSAELYDPATNSWSSAAPMSTRRMNHAAALLQSGRVLVIGGYDPNQQVGVATTETYDPVTNTWSPAGTLVNQRTGATATTLSNGQVLAAGGFADALHVDIGSAEIYDPATNSWSATASLANARQLHVATLLASGKVLVTGGFIHNQTHAALSGAELYDPINGTWSSAGNMTVARAAHRAVRMSNGAVLVIGGGVFNLGGGIINSLDSVEQYEPDQAVVEFYNSGLDNFFITAGLAEQTAIAGGSAGPGWSVTGGFNVGGASQVCRFYGSITPGPNSHFYTIDPVECQSLKDIQASTPDTEKRWNFESLDFSSTIPTAGQCPAGTVPVYRVYNDGFARGVDSNHRITTSQAAYQAQIAKGWKGEGVVMCAPQ
jgi:N-acetylneuraminic acid mutarotase